MDRITADSLETRGIQDQDICATCGRLAGPVVAKAGVFRQTCRCSRSEYVQIPDRDLSQEAELCQCCGKLLFRARSKWSLFFCDPCKALVVNFNLRAGRYAIPIGRHSMHGGMSVPNPKGVLGTIQFKLFALRWNALTASMGLLENHARTVVLQILQERRDSLLDRVPLADYLERCSPGEEVSRKRFRAMLRFLRKASKASKAQRRERRKTRSTRPSRVASCR